MRRLAILVLVPLLLACKARKGDDVDLAGDGNGEPTPAVSAIDPADPVEDACPECAGDGRCRVCGAYRECLLCDGAGACPVCRGDGDGRDGPCEACGRSGECPGCHGDGTVSRRAGETAALPGLCRECRFASGLCPDCGGEGSRPDGETCPRCGGESWCPDCRGAGGDPFCAGGGVCPACEGHGRMRDGAPSAGWPEMRLLLLDGDVIRGTILERPGRTVLVERTRGSTTVREELETATLDPATLLAALRRIGDARSPEDRLAIAEFALERGGECLAVARAEALAAAEHGGRSPRIAAVRAKAERGLAAAARAAAETALRDEEDPRTAWELFVLAGRLAPDGGADDVRAGRAEAYALVTAEEAGLGGELRERRRVAETARLARAVRRGAAWRARSEAILARTGATVEEMLRAFRAAEHGRRELARVASRSPTDVDRAGATSELERTWAVSVRALVGVGTRLLEAGRLERARALAALALAREPESGEAARLAELATAALARAALVTEEGR